MQTYKVLYEHEALDRLKQFIEYLRFSIFKRFSDTGLYGLDAILSHYDEDLGTLESSIFHEFDRLGKLGVIGTIYAETGKIRKSRLIFPIRSYTITAWCTADSDSEILTVESISINT
jgi:hypothetical protein